MEADSFGDVTYPNVPTVFALPAESCVLFTCGAEFCALNRATGAPLFRGRTANDSPVCYAALVRDGEFLLATSSRLLERRSLADGALRGSTFSAMRFSGLVAREGEGDALQLLVGDKFGNVELLSWGEIDRRSTALLAETHRHFVSNPKDAAYAEQYAWLARAFPERFDSTPIAPALPAAPPAAANKFDSGKELPAMLAEFEEAMGQSMLGHLAAITVLSEAEVGGRALCLSADRDEKIRVSRLPALYEIEAIFSGHTEFVTDVVAVPGAELILSCGADRTCRLWSLNEQAQLGPALALPHIPLKLEPLSDQPARFRVRYAGVPTLAEVVIEAGIISLCSEETVLSHIPVALAMPFYLDVTGAIRRVNAEAEPLVIFSDHPRYLRLWKHDHEPDAISSEERLAKRRRGTPQNPCEALSATAEAVGPVSCVAKASD